MSTDLITYLNYISTWETQSDANIQAVIDEHNLWLALGDFDSDDAVNQEFNTLVGLVTDVRNETIAADAIQIAADAAAVAAIWSFGLSMAAFVALEAAEAIDKDVISSKQGDLNNKLKTVDTDIAAIIGDKVNLYVTAYKANNTMLMANPPAGLDNKTVRALLLQFVAQVQKFTGQLNVANFKQYAASARLLFASDEINAVYDALDKLNLSAKTDADIQQFLSFLKGLTFPDSQWLTIVQGLSIAIMSYNLNIANKTIEENAKAAGFEVEEVESSTFGMLDAVGKFVTVVAVVMSVVDVVLDIIDIKDIVQQTNQMVDSLNGSIKQSYLDYFNGIKDSSNAYNAAINTTQKQNPVTGVTPPVNQS
ncbi:hypothetical protein G7054_g3845 [Neopestalotiopsis clavispora]|nr:hypothetical protein G7054_g3845 [Neopestalotiopsis clavispora]